MIWNLLAPIAGSVLGGLFQSNSQKSASRDQANISREGYAAQERIANQNLDFQREMMNNMAMANYPRQRGSNSALQQITDLYGLGDIYAAPTPDSLGGPADFYPATNIPGAQGIAQPGGNNNITNFLANYVPPGGFYANADPHMGAGPRNPDGGLMRQIY